MIKNLRYFIANTTNPYNNIAVEEYLLKNVEPETCILYLWQNKKTVVIGKNQNAWKECNIDNLNEDDGHMARRLSGGGAVFHDMGNLNFTFLLNKKEYNLDNQLEVILKAVNKLGLLAEKTGRNDITIDGKKFSGNAFYTYGNNSYHHGTIMIDVNKELVSKYLNVSAEKLKSKGVSSVKSRIVNLKELYPELTIDLMKEKLLEAFEEVYKIKSTEIAFDELNQAKISEYKKTLESWEWLYGKKMEFEWENSKRFSWGELQIGLNISNGIIKESTAFSDAMDEGFSPLIPNVLKDCSFFKKDIYEKIDNSMNTFNDEQKIMLNDIKELFAEI